MLSIDATVLIIFLIIWILVFSLNKVFFKPVKKMIDERAKRIEENHKAAQEAFQSSEQTVLEIESRLNSALKEAEEIKEKFEKDALKEKGRLLLEIQAEYRNQVESAKVELEKHIERLKKDLDSEAEILAETIEKKFLH